MLGLDRVRYTSTMNCESKRPISLDHLPDPAETLTELSRYAENASSDTYMSGELFDRLENRVRDLLGKEAALYLPSGKIAQMVALKSLTGRANCSRVAMHPRAHFEEYEARAYSELWSLTSCHLGGFDRLPTCDDLSAIKEPLGAITIELPMRRIGCLLPSWETLCGLSAVARERDQYIHLDGARLWESQPFYNRPLSEIAGLFDTVYVAFDKGMGALGGAVLAGPQWLIDEAKIWQRRAGGRTLRSFPYLLSALKALDERLPRMAEFHEKAKEIAKVLRETQRVSVSPNVPQANAFLVSMPGDRQFAESARDQVSKEKNVWLFNNAVDAVDQSIVRFEITIRGAAFDLEISEIKEAVIRFADIVSNENTLSNN